MKKLTAIVLAALLTIALGACGGGAEEPTQPDTPTETNAKPDEAFTFVAQANGISVPIAIGGSPEGVLAALGEADESFDRPSCAVDAKDTTCLYRGLGLELTITYPEQGEGYVTGILLRNDNAQTPEGIRIGSAAEEIKAVYGMDCEESNGFLKYRKGRSVLEFSVSGGEVSQISYGYDFELN